MTGRSDRSTRRRVAWIVGWLVVTAMLALALRNVAWREGLAVVGRARPAGLAAAVVANFLILPAAAWQWSWLLPAGRTVAFRTMFWIRAVTSTVANGGPFLGGYAATVHLLATRGGVGYDTGVSVKAVEQVAEGLAKLALLVAVVLVWPLPGSFRAGALVLLVGVPLLAAVLLLGSHRVRTLERWAAGRDGRLGAALAFAARVADHLRVIRRPRAFGWAVALALVQKVFEGLAIAAVAASLGVDLSANALLLVLAAVNLSTMISITPANLGIYEGAAFAAYRLAGVGSETALGLSVLQHVAYLVPMAGAGWVLLAAEGLRPSRLRSGADGDAGRGASAGEPDRERADRAGDVDRRPADV